MFSCYVTPVRALGRWKGYSGEDWVNEQEISPDLIEGFKRRNPGLYENPPVEDDDADAKVRMKHAPFISGGQDVLVFLKNANPREIE